ncbi:laminin subunit alpha-1-like [Epargyreus clarus]|uniref:laminin subunit alpha-1-like n=1 Tax=Epargyreus clarus TaxID=520877 RepID=UPI003C2F7880
MRWCVVVVLVAVVAEAAGPRRCAGRLARERLKAAEKIRDKRFYLLCCAPSCTSPQRRPRPQLTTRRYQPYHKTWYGLKHGCNCSAAGAESNVCDIRTGQCRCRPHVMGRACDTCEEGYWGLERGGCRRCECGAGAAACDPVSGLCACAAGVGGAKCDRCLPGFYGFSAAGCLPCPTCTEGKVCSTVNGRCECPTRTRGPGCSHCAKGYWDRAAGCRPCNCGAAAISDTCDPVSGQCKCRTGWAGTACEHCAEGHFGPSCRPCHCHAAGTRCDSDVCPCDDQGRCPCKANVVGDKCDECLEGTFGLSDDNPVGCTACFCFGRSAKCTQAEVTRAALHAPAPRHLKLLRAEGITSVDQNSLLAVHTNSPDATIAVPWPPVPVYVELGELFLGDRLLSYGGALRFKVEEEGGEPLPPDLLDRFPLVRLYGPNGIVLDYFERVPAVNGTHVVFLHESLWEVRGRGAIASRGLLMHVLQALERIQVRVSTREPTGNEPLHVLVLHISLETAVPGLARGAPAPGIERCMCPREYASGSCERAASGFWLPRAPPRLHYAAGTIVIQMAAAATPCRCNDRSESCDQDTGHCLNCRNNTGGAQCDRCADGYFGSPDVPGGCQPCPCPSRARSNALSCSLSGARLHCNCIPGYTGQACEQCAPGYRRASNGTCVSCGCDPHGSVSQRCDSRGKCRCRAHTTGDRCDFCAAPRHYLAEEGCKRCDNCTQTLLDTVEGLTSDLHRRADLSELSRIPQPFPALREFSHNTSKLQTALQQAKKDLEEARSLENSIERLEATEHKVFTKAHMLKTEASRREKEAQFLSLESMSSLDDVLKQRREIVEQVAVLNEFAQGEKHLSAHRAIKEARHLLKSIKEVKLADYAAGTTDVSDSANLQSTSLHEYKYRIEDIYKRLQKLKEAVGEWERKADDFTKLSDAVWSASDIVAEVKKRVAPRLSGVRDTGLRCRLVLEDLSNLSTQNLTDDTRAALLHTRNLAVAFPGFLAEMRRLTLAAEEKEGILYSLTPAYKQKYLDAVEKHVAMLGEKAKEYKSLFAGTRAVASAGVQAARAWAEVAEGVREAGAAADAATAAAATAGKLARGPQPLLNTAEAERQTSENLKRRGAEVLAKADELRRQLEAAERGTDVVSVALRALGWREGTLAAGAGEGVGTAGGAGAVEALKGASVQADRVFAASRALYDEAAELRRKVRYQLRRKLATLQRLGDTALGAAEEHVSQIRGNTLRGTEVSEALAAAAAARAREHTAAAASLDPALRALRERVLRAKHAAGTISISISSPTEAEGGTGNNGCARAFAVWGAPSVTRCALTVTFDGSVRDGTLLYIHDQETERYMRLAVQGGKLKLTWDVGGGEGIITHPEVLQPTLDDADHTTYKIEVERVWGSASVRVERAGQEAVEARNTTSGGALPATAWWAGEPRAPLPATLHALHADQRAVGLWAFAAQPPGAKCMPRTHRWFSASRGDQGLVWFSGGGYVELKRTNLRPSDRRRFSLSLTFRTRDHNALLFLALDTVNNRSVSVWVVDCRVVFRVQYAHSRLEIAARAKTCDGRPQHLQASRVFNGLERGSLRVNGEETLGSPTPPVQAAADLPELSDALYWVGGAPPGAGVEAPSLLGCVGTVTVDREGYNLLDTAARYGVELGCGGRTLRSAIFEGEGYVELPSPAFRRKAALGLTFRARSPNGLLLYRSPSGSSGNEVDDEDDGDDKHYLVLALVDGELEVMASAGKNELRLKINGTKLDDGRLHSVRLVRAHKQLEVWCDEKQVGSGALPGGGFPQRSHGLFLGGAPPGNKRPVKPVIPTVDFTGTLMDFIVDSSLIGVESALRWGGVQLGRADAPRPAPPPAPRALHAQADAAAHCSKSSYTVEAGAVRFGDAAGSHATLRVRPRQPRHDFAVSLQLRTFATEGLVFLVPGPRAKPKHFIVLCIREGKLKLAVRGRTRRDLSLPANISDGTWRAVTVRISKTRVVLASGGAAATARAPPLARAAKLFIGGLPPTPPPHIPNSVLRVGGLVGCIRRVSVCGRAEDLVRDARAHHAVGQCFPSVERGAYFAGDAHAVWSSKWWSEEAESIEIKLQFRSTAPTGVIFSAGGLLLELKDGMAVLSLGGARAEAPASCGAWHAVAARAGRWALSLALDAAAAPPALLPQPPADLAARASAPLVIGAVPEGSLEEGRESFKGCIRDVVVGGQKRSWTEMESLHNVLLDSCPTP